MQPKKNPNADLNQNRNLYFVIGLSLVLGITWGAIEYKSYEKAFDLSNIDMLEDDEEEGEESECQSDDRTDEDELDDMTLSLAAMESAVYEDVMAQMVVIEKMLVKRIKNLVHLQDSLLMANINKKT